MPVFWASISIVCAAAVGLFVGMRVAFRLSMWIHRKWEERLGSDAAVRSATAVNWAYERVHERIKSGASIEELHKFVHAEIDRLGSTFDKMGEDIAHEHFASWKVPP